METFDVEHHTAKELVERYKELFSTTLKVEPDPPPSFLEISGFPHYEEVISNWYAFFFDSTNVHGLKTLFIDTLVETINESGKFSELPFFEKCSVIRERTVKDKRIDLLLYDESFEAGGEECYRNAIIVENKIYATLYNELGIYYTNIRTEENKAGVVLSINTIAGLPPTYINVTHKELLNRIMKKIGEYLFRASDKYLLLLKDLIQQINIFNKTENMKEYVNFYFEHAEKINELTQISKKAIDALLDDFNKQLDGTPFRWGRKYPESLNLRCSHHPNILLILHTEKIFDQATYYIELWLTYDFAKIVATHPAILEKVHSNTQPPQDFIFNPGKTGNQYAMLGRQTNVFNRSISDIEQLPTRLAAELKENWNPFLLQIIQILKPDTVTDLSVS